MLKNQPRFFSAMSFIAEKRRLRISMVTIRGIAFGDLEKH
jgi:hypothetical protein